MPSGKLYGNIRTAKLKIADGVVFEGNCEMIKEQKRADLPKKKGEAEAIDA
jgi:cytoskeletal protein CcmA (bactofilin family)